MENLDLNGLRIAEFIEMGTEIRILLSKFSINTLGLDQVFTNLIQAFGNLTDAYSKEKGSPLSKDIELADSRRDQCIIGIQGVAESHLHHFDPQVVSAANLVLQIIHKYGKSIASQNFSAESESLRLLCEELEMPNGSKEALEKLNLVAWVAEMKAANLAFIQLFNQRSIQNHNSPVGNVKELRAEAKKQFQDFMAIAGALKLVSPNEKLAELLKELNAITEKYKQLIANRRLMFFEEIVGSNPEINSSH